ncbi:hypothetical protein TCAL_16532 [Tigriopus californicus]|uniref:rRNA methyltransferase 2, mitochondrial n=2 Tax=Tigriopus californicus TaxID=6832 RepID=A0A553NT10_TIGCA|nr:hypothetical protein TCAL_16532 [Tigriopus californicus]
MKVRAAALRAFHTSAGPLAAQSGSSNRWRHRQATDPFVAQAHAQGYRARSAFKLLDIQSRFRLLKPGQLVIECGCAPGAWSQVAAPLINAGGHYASDRPNGQLIGCDLLPVSPLPGVTFLAGADFTHDTVQTQIRDMMSSPAADVVLSDMAPNASGHGFHDHEALIQLAYAALKFGLAHGRVGSHFLCKIWSGAREEAFIANLQRFYRVVHTVKPKSSRSDSAEKFLLALDCLGIKRKAPA